mgnify:CR=1 FL=1
MLCRIFLWCKYSESETKFGFEEIKKAPFVLMKGAFFGVAKKSDKD